MPANELKPCPFCGGPASLEQCSKHKPHDVLFMPGCSSCNFKIHGGDVGIGWFKGRNAAVEAWNRRPREDRIQRRMERFDSMLTESIQALKAAEAGDSAREVEPETTRCPGCGRRGESNQKDGGFYCYGSDRCCP